MKETYRNLLKSTLDSLFIEPQILEDGMTKMENIDDTTTLCVHYYGVNDNDRAWGFVALKDSSDCVISTDFRQWMKDSSVSTEISISNAASADLALEINVYELDKESQEKKCTLTYVGELDGRVTAYDMSDTVRFTEQNLVCDTTFDDVMKAISSAEFERIAKGDFKEKAAHM